MSSHESKTDFYHGLTFHTFKFAFDGFRYATKQAHNLPVLDRNQFGGVTVNTYTADQRRGVVQHAASKYIFTQIINKRFERK